MGHLCKYFFAGHLNYISKSKSRTSYIGESSEKTEYCVVLDLYVLSDEIEDQKNGGGLLVLQCKVGKSPKFVMVCCRLDKLIGNDSNKMSTVV